MNAFVWLGLGNLALAAPLALAAWLSGKLLNRPAITHGLWVLVLLKLVTPPLGLVPIGVIQQEPPIVAEAPIDVEENAAAVVAAYAREHPEPSPTLAPEVDGHVEDFAAEESTDANPPVAASLPIVIANTSPAPQQTPAPGEADQAAVAVPNTSWFTWANVAQIVPILGGLWLAGATLSWSRALRSSLRFQRLLKQASPAPAELQHRVARLAGELGVSVPKVVFTPGAISPLLWVWGRTASLVLPQALFEQLDDEQQTTLLVHELAHWKRGDHWVRRLEVLAGGLYWWCPLAWWAQAGVRQAEEECCDAWVVATVPDSSRAYALALVETVDFLAGSQTLLPRLASGLGPFPSLQRRLTMIFRTGTHRRLSFLGLVGLIALGGLLLTWSPGPMTAAAQEEAPRPKKKKDGEKRFADEKKEFDDVKKEFRFEKKFEIEFDGAPGREDLERLRRELQVRQQELQQMQMQLERKARELQMMMERAERSERAKDLEGGRPGQPNKVAPRPDVRPDGRPEARFEARPDNRGGDVEQRMDRLEQKLDMMIRELTELRRGAPGRPGQGGGAGFGGPGGGGGFGGQFGPGGAGGPPPQPQPPPAPPAPRREPKERSKNVERLEIEIEVDPTIPPPRPGGPGGVRPGGRNEPGFAPAPVAPRKVEGPQKF